MAETISYKELAAQVMPNNNSSSDAVKVDKSVGETNAYLRKLAGNSVTYEDLMATFDRRNAQGIRTPRTLNKGYISYDEAAVYILEEADLRRSGDEALQKNIDKEIEDRIADVDAEEARAISEENKINEEIGDPALEAIEGVSEARPASGLYKIIDDKEARLQKEIDDETDARIEGDDLLNARISAEVERAESRENEIEANLTAEISRATTAEEDLNTKIDNEVVRATAAEDAINEEIGDPATVEIPGTDEVEGIPAKSATGIYKVIDDKEAALQSLIMSETERALSVEDGLRTAISEEASTRADEDDAIRLSLTEETNRAKAAEKENKDAITILNSDTTVKGSVANTVDTAIAKVLDGAPEAFDTLKEIADWISSDEAEDADIIARVSTNETKIDGLRTDLTQEVEDRINGDQILTETLEKETADRTNSDEVINKKLSDEITARIESDNTLKDLINTEKTERKDSDTALRIALKEENDARVAGDSHSEGRIDQLEKDIATMENNHQAQIDAEISRASTEEGKLREAINTETERALFVEGELRKAIKAETERAIAAETSLGVRIDEEAKTRKEEDDKLQNQIDILRADLEQERKERIAADEKLEEEIRAEEKARIEADEYLQSEIDELQRKIAEIHDILKKYDSRMDNLEYLLKVFITKPEIDDYKLKNSTLKEASVIKPDGTEVMVDDVRALVETYAFAHTNGKFEPTDINASETGENDEDTF